MDNKKLIKLINVPSRVDADILRSQLQAAGIISIEKSPWGLFKCFRIWIGTWAGFICDSRRLRNGK